MSNSGNMTTVLGIDSASCSKKLLQVSEHFSESLLSINLNKLD